MEKCKDATFSVESLEQKPAKKSPTAPFTTSTLQQEASRKLGFSVNQTMMVAQKLYEAGMITYMRTDSVNLSQDALAAAELEITNLYGEDFAQRRVYTSKAKGAQEAHEAIRPSYMNNKTVDGDSSHQRLYDLIWKRTISSQMADAQFDRTTVKKWRVKEEWYFDKQRSVMDVRIIGICPMQEGKDEITGEPTGFFDPLFWVYFPDARPILANAEIFNLMKNDAERRTYDDIFWKRMFSSYIIKESNVMDRKLNEYMIGLDAILKSEEIKSELFNIEHDLWEY
jgi:gliding motility associated protien GldN